MTSVKKIEEEFRATAWCFTWNNAPEDWNKNLIPKSTYLIGGWETGDSGTRHIQGYVEWKSKRSFATMKKIAPVPHWEPREGTAAQASDYCQKQDDDPFILGKISRPGTRTDLQKVREVLKTGNMRKVVDEAESCQSVRYAEMYLKVRERKRVDAAFAAWLFGRSGVGKTQTAMWDAFRHGYTLEDIHVIGGDNGKWWEGYDAHPVVIIDDIRATFCTFSRMLNILDKYECRVECKGASRQLLARRIYITCPYRFDEIWDTSEQMDQLYRRLNVIQEIISFDGSEIHKGDAIDQTCPPNKNPQTGESQDEGVEGSESLCSESGTEGRDEEHLDP